MLIRMAYRGALCLFLGLTVSAAHGQRIVKLDSRPGVEQYYLLLNQPGVTYKAAIIFFPGAGQELHLATDGIATYQEQGGNFLAGTWQRTNSDIVVAIMDPPSDTDGTFTYDFRTDDRHVEDIAAVMRDLKARFPGIRIYLVGSSNGTISATYAGLRLGNRLAGIVLMSSVRWLRIFDFSSIRVPVLFVHDVDDECFGTPYAAAERLARDFALISVSGGDPPESGPCGPRSAHTFFGKRKEIAIAIARWIFGRPFPRRIR